MGGYTDSFGTNPAGIWVFKLSNNGNVEWEKVYLGERYIAPGRPSHTSIWPTSDGGYIVTGSLQPPPFPISAWALKLDSQGNIVWQKRYRDGFTSFHGFRQVQETSDGGYITTGLYGGNILIVKLNSNGTIQWSKSIGAGGEWPLMIKEESDGSYLVGGVTTSFGAGGEDMWLIKLSNSGEVLWQKSYGSVGNEELFSLRDTPDGGYIITGFTDSYGAGGVDVWVLKLLQDGRCPPFGMDTNASIQDVSLFEENTNVSAIPTSAVVSDITLTVRDTYAIVKQQAP